MEIFGLPIWTVALVCVGVFCASFMDAIGGGGGIISLPTYLLAGLPMHYALGTNKLSSCIGTVASTVRFIKNGCVDWLLGIPSIALALVGAHLGTKLHLAIDEQYLKLVLLVVLPVIAVILLKKKELPDTRLPMNPWARRGIVWGASLLFGAYDGFYGPGTGTFLLLGLTALGHMPLQEANGTTKVINLTSNITALAVFLINGKVLLPLGIVAGLFNVAGNYLGARMFEKGGAKAVKPVMVIVLIIFFIRVITDLI